MSAILTSPESPQHSSVAEQNASRGWRLRIDEILNRHPAVGLAVGVIRNAKLEFYGHGYADLASMMPITEDTIFRVASLTKLFTAVAVMQLWEQGRIDLDAPANEYLRAYELVPAKAGFRQATVRHLLTHSAGIPEVRSIRDVLHPDWGAFMSRPAVSSVRIGEPLPSLAECYRSGLRITCEPGTAFQYSNHGFATLGQIVEDVSGDPLERYFHERIFEPLGMTDSDLSRSPRVSARLATGYELGSSGARPVADRDWVSVGATNIYSTTRDLGRFVAALLAGGAGELGAILKPATLAMMFAFHYQADPRLAGVGLGFFTARDAGHRVVDHDGVLPGFNSRLVVAPDDGVGLIALTNGSPGAFGWLPIELEVLLHRLLGIADHVVRPDIAHHPEIWEDLRGVYLPRFVDIRGRPLIGGGLEVVVRGGQLFLRARTPIPAAYRGVPLHPDNETDPYAFRIDLSPFGMGTPRVVFSRDASGRTTALHADIWPLSFDKPIERAGREHLTRVLPAVVLGATALALLRRRGDRRGAGTR